MKQLRRVGIFGTGSYVPERVLKNDDFKQWVDTSDEWITRRTGIKERRWARDDEYTSDMAAAAAERALEMAGWQPDDVDFVICGTCSGDNLFPNTANWVSKKLGISNRCGAIDATAACSSFVYSLALAGGMIASGMVNRALVMGAEKLSSIINLTDRSSCIMFGDGAGALCLRALEPDEPDHGTLINQRLGSEFNYDALSMPSSGCRMPQSYETVDNHMATIHLEGRTIYRFAVNRIQEEIRLVTEEAGHKLSEVDYIVPHQVNARILESAVEKLGMNLSRFHVNIDRVGNTSSASVPLALDEAVRQGKIEFGSGKLFVLVAFGGGLSWGSHLVRA